MPQVKAPVVKAVPVTKATFPVVKIQTPAALPQTQKAVGPGGVF